MSISRLAVLLFVLAMGTHPAVSRAYGVPSDVQSKANEQPARALTRDDLAAWLDGFIPFALQRGDVAGGVVVVVKDGSVLLEKGYGYADMATREPVDPLRTLFRPGSTSKLFTWTAVMQLVEQGRLDLDTDINRYLDFRIPAYAGMPITLRNVMTHTAGFEEQGKGLFGTERDTDLSLESYVKRSIPKRIFPPGHTPAYSNYATALAGYIVARVSGQSFDDYIEQHIFAPLQMSHSSFRLPLSARLKPDASKGYGLASEPAKPYELVAGAPAGNLASTGDDMSRFMIAHLNDGAFEAARILQAQTARQMHTSALTMIPPLNRMVLGFYETGCNGHHVISHGGDTQWFHTYLRLFIDDGVGLYISLNSAGRDSASEVLREALFDQFCDRYFPGPTLNGRVEAVVAAEHARLISASHYELSRRTESGFSPLIDLFGQATLAVNEEGMLQFGQTFSGQPRKWREVAPFVWREIGGKALLAAKVEGGRIARFSHNYMSPFMVFEPVPAWRSAAWLLPALTAGFGVMILAVVLWPAAWLVRRHLGVPQLMDARRLRARRWARASTVAALALCIAWIATIMVLSTDNGFASPRFDPLFLTLQLLSLVIFGSACGLTLWSVYRTAKTSGTIAATIGEVLLAASCALLLWVAFTFGLIRFNVVY